MIEKNLFIKNRQFLPGPTPIPTNHKNTHYENITYHRSKRFGDLLNVNRQLLTPIFGSTNLPLILTCSGTGAMESSVVNLTEENDEILVLSAGRFGQRWVDLLTAYHCTVHTLKIHSDHPFPFDDLKKILTKNIKAIFFQASETSTGAYLPVSDICKKIKENSEALIVVDAISALCAHQIKMDEWQIDCLISGSQKGFGVPPGLAFVALSDKAMKMQSRRARFYFDYIFLVRVELANLTPYL